MKIKKINIITNFVIIKGATYFFIEEQKAKIDIRPKQKLTP